jgi:transposase InsO family protein
LSDKNLADQISYSISLRNPWAWRTFLRNHAAAVWACDFLKVTDLFFRPLFAFFIIELKSRKVIHVNVTRSPTDLWVAQQLREATPYGQTPKYLIRDNDKKFGSNFARVATISGIQVLRTPYRTPQANAVCERFLGSVRRECLDHYLILGCATSFSSPLKWPESVFHCSLDSIS